LIFLEDNKELLDVQSNKTGYSVEDHKKLVIEYHEQYYIKIKSQKGSIKT
jgi:hypothetical protein